MNRSTGGATRPRLARCGVAAIAVVMLVAACGSDSSDVAAAAPTGAATTSASPIPTEPPPAAADFVLTEGAETVGYTAGATPDSDGGTGNTGNQSDDGDEPDMAEVAQCLGVDPIVFDDGTTIDEATGADFTYDFGDFPTVSSESHVAPTETIAAQADVVADPGFGSCFGGALADQLQAEGAKTGVSYEIVAIESVPPPPGSNGAVRMSFGISADGQSFGFVLEAVYLFRGQVGVFLTFLNQDNVTPPGDVALMVSQIDAKLDQQ